MLQMTAATKLSPTTVPSGYPRACEEVLELSDGQRVFVRPVLPEDATLLSVELEHADPETLYNRFFRTSMRVDAALLEYLTVLDYRHRFALAAFGLDGSAAGIARYEGAVGADTAEVAVAVKPGWRKKGLGTALLVRLEQRAREAGIRHLRADFLEGNEAAAALVARAGFQDPISRHGICSIEHELTD